MKDAIANSPKKGDNKDSGCFYIHGQDGFSNIKTLVVFTTPKNDSVELKRSQNNSLLSVLKDGGYKYVPANGLFNNKPEDSYMVFNMSLKTAKILCRRFEQTSFIWSQFGDDGSVYSQYRKKQNVDSSCHIRTNDYRLKDECDTWIDPSDAEDGFTVVGKEFKYSVPLGVFENINKKFDENIKRICEHESNRGSTISSNEILDFAINRVGLSPFLYRKAITRNRWN